MVDIRRRAPEVPAICLTATATEWVQHEIRQYMSPKLEMLLVRASVYRPNLHLGVRFKHSLNKKLEVCALLLMH